MSSKANKGTAARYAAQAVILEKYADEFADAHRAEREKLGLEPLNDLAALRGQLATARQRIKDLEGERNRLLDLLESATGQTRHSDMYRIAKLISDRRTELIGDRVTLEEDELDTFLETAAELGVEFVAPEER